MTKTVYIPAGPNARTKRVYHTNPECRYVRDGFIQKPVNVIPSDFSECSGCHAPPNPDMDNRRLSLEELIERGDVETQEAKVSYEF